MLRLLEACRRLWFLFLSFFRSDPKKDPSTNTALPVFSNRKIRVIGNPVLISSPHPMYGLATTRGPPPGSDNVCHPTSNVNSNLRAFYLPLDRLPSNGHPQRADNHLPSRECSLPRPRSISVVSTEDEFSTPVIPNAHLPAVIVTPSTPSSEVSKIHTDTSGADELSSDEDGESSGFDTSCITSIDSNPFLTVRSSPLPKEFDLPPLGALNHHHRARSLTGTGRGRQHQRLSQSDSFSSTNSSPLPVIADATTILSNPLKKCDVPQLIEDTVTPSASEPDSECDSGSRAITDRIRSSMTSASSKDSTLAPNIETTSITVASTHHSEDPKTGVPPEEDESSRLAFKNAAIVMDQIMTPSNSSSSGHDDALLLGVVVPYPEVFDLDAYFGPDSSSHSQITLHSSSLNSSCSTGTSEPKDSFSISATPSAALVSSTIFVSAPPEPLRNRISNMTDTTASSTSIYALSLSNMSTDTDTESASSHCLRRFGSLHDSRRSRVTFDREVSVKRYRDHYRPPAYSRPPAFVVESPTTSRKFISKRASDEISVGSANKENEVVRPTSAAISPIVSTTSLNKEIANPCLFSSTAPLSPVRHQQVVRTSTQKFQAKYTLESPTTTSQPAAGPIPAGKNVAILGPVAISQRRQMDIFG